MLEIKIQYLLALLTGNLTAQSLVAYVCDNECDLDELKYAIKMQTTHEKIAGIDVTPVEMWLFLKLQELPKSKLIDLFEIEAKDWKDYEKEQRRRLEQRALKVLAYDYTCRYEGTKIELDAAFFYAHFQYKKTAKGMISIVPTLDNPILHRIVDFFESEEDYLPVRAIQQEIEF